MMRRLITVVLTLSLFLVFSSERVASATASPVTVSIDQAVGLSQESCTSAPWNYQCDIVVTGVGVTLGSARPWTFKLKLHTGTSHPCLGLMTTGAWEITAADGSGDGLFGTVPPHFTGPMVVMKVTGGSGAYAGLTDASAGGASQAFGQVVVPTLFLTGCGYVATPVYQGSFEFDLVPA